VSLWQTLRKAVLCWWRCRKDHWDCPDWVETVNAEMGAGVIAEIGETLEALSCGHGGSVKDTPPMFYPEWIRCVVAYHQKRGLAETVEPKG
jgi:hypothetical protein